MSDHWAEFGRAGTSPACAREAHGECAHAFAWGGGFNPRRLRLEFGPGLCPCSCHSSCPVALSDKRMTVPLAAWRESCTCPGAEQERRRLDQDGGPRDFDDMLRAARHRSQVRREAFEAARARVAGTGKGRDEIREIYLAELDARGLTKPGDTVVDAIVDRLSGHPLHAARLAAESLVQAGKAIYELSRRLRSGG